MWKEHNSVPPGEAWDCGQNYRVLIEGGHLFVSQLFLRACRAAATLQETSV